MSDVLICHIEPTLAERVPRASILVTRSFSMRPPAETEVAFHESWCEAHGTLLFEAQTFTYERLDLAEVAAATQE